MVVILRGSSRASAGLWPSLAVMVLAVVGGGGGSNGTGGAGSSGGS